jgi:ubiquitin carboxyl-terminal hydrolase 5/13
MEKTEKTMAELEIDQNVKFEWDSITEAGAALKPLSGPGWASDYGTSAARSVILAVIPCFQCCALLCIKSSNHLAM